MAEKPVFACELCPARCGRKTDLRIHVQKLHTSDKPLKCKRCGKSFPDRYSCKIHNKASMRIFMALYKLLYLNARALWRIQSFCRHTKGRNVSNVKCARTPRRRYVIWRHTCWNTRTRNPSLVSSATTRLGMLNHTFNNSLHLRDALSIV